MTMYQDPNSPKKIRPELMGLFGMNPRIQTPQLGRPNGKKKFAQPYQMPMGLFNGPISTRFHEIVQQLMGGLGRR